jgi:hypothetical protein
MKRLLPSLLVLLLATPTLAARFPHHPQPPRPRVKVKEFHTPAATVIIANEERGVRLLSTSRKEIRAADGAQTIQVCGTRTQPIKATGNVIIKGGPGATLRTGGSDGITLTNCTKALVQGPLKITGCFRGMRIVQTNRTVLPVDSVVVDGVTFDGNSQQGILTNDAHGVTVRNCKISNTHTEHALYFSGRGKNLRVENCTFTNTGRSSWQFNGEGSGELMEGEARNVTVDNSFACSFLSVKLKMTGCNITGRPKAITVDTFVPGKPSVVTLLACTVKGNNQALRGSVIVK